MRLVGERHGARIKAARRMALLTTGALLGLVIASCGNNETPAPSAQSDGSASSASAKYKLAGGSKTLVGPGGQLIPIRPKAIVGFADNVIPEGDVVNVTGWAAAGDYSAPARRVVSVVDGVEIGRTKPSAKRPDVVKAYDAPMIKRSGFALFVETDALDCSAPIGGLTVFAIAKGVAAPLPLVGNSEAELDAAC